MAYICYPSAKVDGMISENKKIVGKLLQTNVLSSFDSTRLDLMYGSRRSVKDNGVDLRFRHKYTCTFDRQTWKPTFESGFRQQPIIHYIEQVS